MSVKAKDVGSLFFSHHMIQVSSCSPEINIVVDGKMSLNPHSKVASGVLRQNESLYLKGHKNSDK